MQLDDTAHILGSADFFSICTLEQRRMLAFASERVSLSAGDTLFVAGEVTDGAYVLISGELKSSTSTDEEIASVFITQPGTAIGELSLVAKHPRRATITCKSDVELLSVPRTAFSKLIQQFPDIAERAVEYIRNDISKYVSSLEALGTKSSLKR